MSEVGVDPSTSPFLSAEDVRRAATANVLSRDDAERLLQWAQDQRTELSAATADAAIRAVEQNKGFNLVTVAYYFGAMLIISACAWFLGENWNALGSKGILITSLSYAAITALAGAWLRRKGYLIGGGLLITVAVSLAPLVVYALEAMFGVWPVDHPGAYKDYYPGIHGWWMVMEITTAALGAIAFRFVRFGFLTAPISISFWFLSMDAAAWYRGEHHLGVSAGKWVSVGVGLLILLVGFGLDKTLRKQNKPKTEDVVFWCYLFGLMAFWGGLSSMNSTSEVGCAIYAAINLGLIGLAVKLRRVTFLLFGAVGVYIYLAHLAYKVFKDSTLFPFILAFLGLSLILATVWAQRRFLRFAR